MKTRDPNQKVLNVWAIILIVWSFYRFKFKLPEWFDEFIAKPLIFILPVWYYITRIELKPFFSAIDLKFNEKKDYIVGIVIGLVFCTVALIGQLMRGQGLSLFKNIQYSGGGLVLMILLPIATALSEEILSRGFVLKRLYSQSHNIYTASFYSSILFVFLHIPILFTNLNLSGNVLLFILASDFLLSLINSFIFIERKNLIVPILIHILYNFALLLLI